MFRSVVIAAAAGLSLAAVAQVQAEERKVAISTRGLDLSDPAGAKAFYDRVGAAVAQACGGAPTYFFTSEIDRFERCYKAGVDSAVEQAHAPLVTALHQTSPRRQLAAR